VKAKRGLSAGEHMANSIIEFCHMMYNVNTAKRVLVSCIDRLQKSMDEYKSISKRKE
jgi:hypothetical protein